MSTEDRSPQASVGALNRIIADAVMIRLIVEMMTWQSAPHDPEPILKTLQCLRNDLEAVIQRTARRCRVLGGDTPGDLNTLRSLASVKTIDRGADLFSGAAGLAAHLRVFSESLSMVGMVARESGDEVTGNLLISLAEGIDECAWRLEGLVSHHRPAL